MRLLNFRKLACDSIKAGAPTLILLSLLACLCQRAEAQWITQTNSLKPGWNAVFLQVDASPATLDQLVGNDLTHPIDEIWYWRPTLPTGQFVESPQIPNSSGSEWSTWTRLAGPASGLQRLTGNGAYLVRVANTVSSY